MFPHSKRVLGLRNRSSFGLNSTRRAQIWPYACVPDPNCSACCSEPSREGRASVCNRAVERRFRAISADWRFWLWGGKTAISRNDDIEPLPNSSSSEFPPQIYSQATRVSSRRQARIEKQLLLSKTIIPVLGPNILGQPPVRLAKSHVDCASPHTGSSQSQAQIDGATCTQGRLHSH